MKKLLTVFLAFGLFADFAWAIPGKIEIFLGGFGQHAYFGGHFGGTSEYDFSSYNGTVQSFKEALWGKITEKFCEIAEEKIFDDEEKKLMKKTSDYFAEFCYKKHQGEGWYAENVDLEGMSLQTSYVKQNGWYNVTFYKRKPAPFEKDLSHTWHLDLTGF